MQKLDPKAAWLFFINSVFRFLFLTVLISFFFGISFFSEEIDQYDTVFLMLSDILWWLWIVVPAVIILSFVFAKLTYHFYRYELREDDGFRKEYGIIWKKYVTIPYDRIQNVDIYRGIWARILGLSDIHIQTAGMSASVGRYGASGVGTEGRLPAISKDEAERIRDELIRRARTSRNQGL